MENFVNNNDFKHIIDELCKPESYEKVMHIGHHDVPMPSTEVLGDIVELLRAILFPGYYGYSHLTLSNMKYYLGANLDKVYHQLSKQLMRGICFTCSNDENSCDSCTGRAVKLIDKFFETIPRIRYLLSKDVQAAYEGDPAAKNTGVAIFCYPSIRTLTNYRIAHELYKIKVPLIPRIITELAHSETGVDINPGAQIGEKFFMDHCTGIVIGETTIIGRNVTLYQGVTLGAKSFPLDSEGNPIKGINRHPIVEDNVIIYAGATILGRVTIGEGSVIGGNVWITRDIAPYSKILQGKPVSVGFEDGAGI
jgi:serine O-acetyltransferase